MRNIRFRSYVGNRLGHPRSVVGIVVAGEATLAPEGAALGREEESRRVAADVVFLREVVGGVALGVVAEEDDVLPEERPDGVPPEDESVELLAGAAPGGVEVDEDELAFGGG